MRSWFGLLIARYSVCCFVLCWSFSFRARVGGGGWGGEVTTRKDSAKPLPEIISRGEILELSVVLCVVWQAHFIGGVGIHMYYGVFSSVFSLRVPTSGYIPPRLRHSSFRVYSLCSIRIVLRFR